MSCLRLYLLGPPRVELDGVELHIPRRKATALLAYLAVTGQIHQRDSLATLLWPGYDQPSARTELRRMLSTLNRALGTEWLVADRETAGLDASAEVWTDVRAFRDGLASCKAHGHPRDQSCSDRLSLLQEVAALYRDDFLAGFTLPDSAPFDEWQRFLTQSLRDELAALLEQLAAAYEDQAKHDQAIAHARRWLSLDPLHEPAHRALMRLYAASGRRIAALRQYRQCVRTLEEELGLAPAAETTVLYERVRDERPQPAQADVIAPAAVPTPLPAFLVDEEKAELAHPVFVSREPELAQLRGYLEAVLDGKGGVAFITGDAGRGKTALMAELARRATEAQPELLVAWGTCNAYAGLGDPYLPFREVLSALTGDVGGRWAADTVSREQVRRLWEAMPATIDALLAQGEALFDTFVPARALLSRAEAAAPEGASWQRLLKERIENERAAAGDLAQGQFLGQVTEVLRALSAQHPLLLCLDDLQWIDAASAAVLFHLGRHLQGSRMLIVGAYRPDEMALGRGVEPHPLAQVLAELKRQYGDVWVDLGEADAREGRAFVDAYLDSEPNRLGDGFRAALYAHTGGHPLFTVELLRAMQVRGELVRNDAGYWVEGSALHWEQLPARAEAVIEARLGRLPPELRELLAAASVGGEAFAAQVVAQVQGMGERQVLHVLSGELERRHQLVREEGVIFVGGRRLVRYRFAHALYHQHLYNNLGQGERSLLHGEVAEALEGLYAGRTDEVVPQLAHHYAEAGDAARAIPYLDRAGDRARLAYAHKEAIEHYARALALQEELGDHEGAGRTLMKLGLAHHTGFDFARAQQAFEESFAHWQRAGRAAPHTPSQPAPHALRIRWWDPYALDPALCSDLISCTVIEQIFSGLISLGPDLGLVPELARSWDVLDGGHRYVFHLREDARWSDGVPVTAQDVEYAWRRSLGPSASSAAAGSLSDVIGAQAARQQGGAALADLGIRVLDNWTLEVELNEASSDFAYRLRAMGAVPRHVVEAHGAAWTGLDKIVVNGPFRPVDWEQGERMLLVRNPTYHGLFTGNVEQVALRLDLDRVGALSAYREGSLDILPVGASAAETDRARREFGGELVSLPELTTRYLSFDTSRPPFADPQVRRAFALAIDRERLARVGWRGLQSPATGGLVPPGMPGHSPGIALPYDPDEARRLLAQAGYPRGAGFPELEALTPSGISVIPIHLQAQWRDELGVEVTWERLALSQLPQRLRERLPHLHVTGWVADWPDPDSFLEESRVCERTGWSNAAYRALRQRARQSVDQEERMRLLQQVDRIVVQEAPIVPMLYGRRHTLVKPWIRGFRLSALLGWYWQDIVIEPH